ncbi:MAG TPA: FAD-dependent oxidoreductase [Thiolapillus brandeum]|uniref:FAD-dependent oxidoreductase n=1 Tax=Thiolapillus brandeum TaxID=1076588 RepID=A0A7C5IYR3_9GAMM|nr:FAD-dependent oxidoreductase [Thiolapillus brandeum]
MKLDLLIFGGGIAGLWTLLRARAAGHSALLLELRALGGVQSIASQGIIHGGTKYALGGRLSEAARAIGEMPGRWRACLAGRGELDLTGVRLLSSHQYLWSPGGVASALAGFFASRAMRSRVTQVSAGELPPPFDDPGFRGRLYRLDEPVLDTASLLGELARQARAWCRRYDPATLVAGRNGIEVEGVALQPRRILLAAGAGNEALLRTFGRSAPAMQRRPLHMVMARGPLPQLFAHALAASSNPRITVTSYPCSLRSGAGAADSPSETVWYLGGELAEKGVGRSREAQIEAARRELGVLLPWLDLNRLRWSTLRIDRAEVATADGSRPDGPFVGTDGDLLVTWPTKLAFAPRVADQVLEALGGPEHGGIEVATGLPAPPLATLPWEETTWS